MADLVRLRPIAAKDLELFERLREDPSEAGEFDFFGFRNPGETRRRFAEGGFLGETAGSLAVAAADDDRFVGEVQWHRVLQGPDSPCWNIGIMLLAGERGKGFGKQSQRLLAEYLFAHTKVNRVEASTEVVNIAEQRALERAGFTREGVLRGACFRAGAWRDMIGYSILRAEVPAKE
ncbi:MAG TPA: GNAT family protein [Actinospica sp.]|nr:GNAT family protein [Actinospica sp.]